MHSGTYVFSKYCCFLSRDVLFPVANISYAKYMVYIPCISLHLVFLKKKT